VFNFQWKPYVSVAERRRKAEREMQKLKKKGQPVSPVVVPGRTIASTFWGKAWCDNLERYSDFSNRLPRGRTYVRNGSVIDLQISPGEVKALVNGSEIYKVAVNVSTVPKPRWSSICTDCAGAIDSLVELLQGQFSKGVMTRICQDKTGLFPAPSEIKFSCSCPDWASMCKHVAAVFYGIGARLDEQPELLFKLRKVDHKELIAKVGRAIPLPKKHAAESKVLATEGLSELFGLEMATGVRPRPPQGAAEPSKTTRRRRDSKVSVHSKEKIPTAKTVKSSTPKLSSPIGRDYTKGPGRSANEASVAKTVKPRTTNLSSPIKHETLEGSARTANECSVVKTTKVRNRKVSSATKRNASKARSEKAINKKLVPRGVVRAAGESTGHASRK
jgi:uncharacterized Zn finger protein